MSTRSKIAGLAALTILAAVIAGCAPQQRHYANPQDAAADARCQLAAMQASAGTRDVVRIAVLRQQAYGLCANAYRFEQTAMATSTAPFSGTIEGRVVSYCVGAVNVDECRTRLRDWYTAEAAR